jgi:hypothetical protein
MCENVTTEQPEKFSPRMLKETIIYPNLKGEKLTSGEKVWLCQQFDCKSNDISLSGIASRYNLSEPSLRNWYYRNYKKSQPCQYEPGKPSYLTKTVETSMKDFLHQSFVNEDNVFAQEARSHLLKTINEDRAERNKPSLIKLASGIEDMYLASIGASDVKPQAITDARWNSAHDIRMTYSLYVMCLAFTPSLAPEMLWNWDFTQFSCTTDHTGALVCCLREDLRTGKPASKRESDETTIFIKWMLCCNAAGSTVPLVLNIAIPDMEDDGFEVYSIPGLTYKTSLETGYLIFTKSRCGNDRSLSFFIREIVIKAITESRNFLDLKVFFLSFLFLSVTCVFYRTMMDLQ